MLAKRELSFDDYRGMLKRRYRMVIVVTLSVTALAYLATLVLPAKYTSLAKILIEQPQVPPDMVRPVVDEHLDQRLALMRQQVLSRARLQPIIERYGLYKDLASSGPDQMVAQMISDTDVQLLTAQNNGHTEITGFTVSYTAPQPKMAQQVCTDITSLFLQENLHEREQALAGTTDFLDRQLNETKEELNHQDARLAEFKGKYMGQVPGKEDVDMSLLMSMNNQLEAVTEAIYRSQQDKAYAEQMLAQQLAAHQSTQTGDSNPAALQQQLKNMEAQLVILEGRYTPEYPDVIKLKTDIAQVKGQLQAAQSSSTQSPAKADNPALEPAPIQQLRYQIHQYDENIKARTREENRLQQQISQYQGRLNMSPKVEQEYKQLTRDYETALKSYNDLLAKKGQAEMATDLERRQQGEQFRLLDPPAYPTKPSFPDPLLFSLGGLGGGLMLACGIALIVEMIDTALRTPQEVEFYLELPVLAVLPRAGVENGNGNRKTRFWSGRKSGAVTQTGVGT